MPFPDEALDVWVELKLGDQWVNIKTDGHVYTRDPITITRGRGDEGSRTDPSTCTLTINNRDGRYSPRNPLGPYYGRIGRNTPIRVSVPTGGAPALTVPDGAIGSYASTPDAAALDITGDLDVRVEAEVRWVGGASGGGLVGKYIETGAQRSWVLWLDSTGELILYWSSTGANLLLATSTVPVPALGRQAVRATLDVNNGASGNTVTFYTAPSIAGPWTQLGAPIVQADTTSIFDSASPVQVGEIIADPVAGRYYAMELRNGIGGMVVADPDFTAQAVGTTAFADAAGRSWTVAGDAAITDRDVRFSGEVPSWPIKWNTSGTDVWVTIEAAGILRRLGQGAKPLGSALRRAIGTFQADDARIVAYWPLEDSAGSTQAASAIGGVPPLRALGPVEFSAEPSGGTGGGVSVGDVGRLTGATPSPGTEWTIMFWFDLAADMGTDAASPVVQWRTPGSNASYWSLFTGQVLSGTLILEGANAAGSVVVSANGTADVRGRGPVQIVVTGDQDGANYQVAVAVDGELDTASISPGDVCSPPTSIGINLDVAPGEYSGSVSHLLVATHTFESRGYAAALVPVGSGHRGETAGARFLRLTGEEGVPADLVGVAADSEPMGAQQPKELLELLGECADADGGTLYERRDGLGLRYRTRAADYNTDPALTLDYHDQLAAPLEPVDDDQATRNDVTVEREGGSSARVTVDQGPLSTQPPPDGVGVYNESVTLNLADDDQLLAQAGWRAHLGTVDEARYPVVRLKLHKHYDLAPAVVAADIRARIHLSGLPAWEPPGTVDLLADGYTETIEPRRWTIEYNTVPGSPWRVAVADNTTLGRVDTDGTVLLDPVTATDTTLPVLVTGAAWTTDPADYPFDLTLGGEVVTATAASDKVLDNFADTAAGGWGSADTGQAWTVAAGSAADFSAAGGTGGVIASPTAGVERAIVIPTGSPQQSTLVYSNTPLTPTGAPITWGVLLRYTDASNYYWLGVQINTAGTLTLIARKRVAGAFTTITSVASATGHSTSVWRILRAEALGTTLRAKVWAADAAEPAAWELTTTDAALSSGGSAGCIARRETGNTNSTSTGFDIFTAYQSLTVTRAVNGISKAQAAGIDIRLAQPSTIAL
ncbi:hypothetical protein [Actinomadura rubrisoli]|uniref:Uncharacterized protein n=1 Tax=Actinomadura rubrisoli TaxID=2530368 RepID=A0A4R5BND1_9ACTN|nr:hypothetical protein [Actinomadura rubrisoli]TDD88351.1 hypothetical protein E1298_15175 [Actinomadura rubrisoli]